MAYDNTNTGILAANARKEKETHPTHTGSINVDGVEYWLSAWVNEGKPGSKLEGKKYFSLKINRKEAAPQSRDSNERVTPQSWAAKTVNDIYGDDIPF